MHFLGSWSECEGSIARKRIENLSQVLYLEEPHAKALPTVNFSHLGKEKARSAFAPFDEITKLLPHVMKLQHCKCSLTCQIQWVLSVASRESVQSCRRGGIKGILTTFGALGLRVRCVRRIIRRASHGCNTSRQVSSTWQEFKVSAD